MTSETATWRGVSFAVSLCQGMTRWVSDDGELWTAAQYREGELWFARLRVGVQAYTGSGNDARAALDGARANGRAALRALRRALEGAR